MKKIILLLVLTFLIQQASAQVNRDSLWAVWNNKQIQDTTRINAMIKLGGHYNNNRPDSGLIAGQLAYDLAQKSNNYLKMGGAKSVMGHSNTLMGRMDEAILHYMEGIDLLEKSGNKKALAGCLINASMTYRVMNNVNESAKYLDRGYNICKEIRDTAFMLNALNSKAQLYLQNDPNIARASLTEALDVIKHYRSPDVDPWVRTMLLLIKTSLGSLVQQAGNHAEALIYFNEALKLAERENTIGGRMTLYSFMGISSAALKEYEQAKRYFLKSQEEAEQVGIPQAQISSLSNIGSTELSLGNGKAGIAYYRRALAICEQIGDYGGSAGTLNAIGAYYEGIGRCDSALMYFQKSLERIKKIQNKDLLCRITGSLGSAYLCLGDNKNALKYNSQSLKIAQEISSYKSIQLAAERQHKIYKNTGNYKLALEMLELSHAMLDTIEREENQRAVIRQEFQFSYEKQKALDDKENEQKLAIEAERRHNQQQLTWAIGISLFLISLLALGIFNRLRVTRRQKAIIEEQKAKVEQSEKYKEQFLANMSHELRTPMHAISGMLGILQRNKHLTEQEPYLQAMHTSAENLVVILNDVLDLSKIEAGKLDIEQVPTAPGTVLGHVMQVMQYKAEEKGLTLHHTVAEDVPAMVTSDPTRLNQMLINLVGNAIKFTEKGSINVALSRQNDRLRFAVSDTGIGIPKDKLESIFMAFEQAEQSTARHYGGTGLGLAITRQLATLQGGRVWAESNPGHGSTFYLELPLIAVASGAVSSNLISEAQLKTMAAALKGTKILMAEDNPFNQMIAQDDLAYYIGDVKVEVVHNGAEAVQKFREEKYDIILMDVQMPELNGFEATSAIRTLEREQGLSTGIPIVAMTASLLTTEIDRCYASGMNNYIPKPYKPVQLIGVLYQELKEKP